MTLAEKEKVKTGAERTSPFSVSIPTELRWETMTTREQPSKNSLLDYSEATEELCKDLSVIGVIGGLQAQRIYLNNNKKRLKKATDLKILKRHEIIRGKNSIPIYTLGATGMMLSNGDLKDANKWKTYNAQEVLKRLVFFQLYGSLKAEDNKVSLMTSPSPFMAAINRNGKEFHILIVRGNENAINHFFRYEKEKVPKRMLIVVEELSHLMPIETMIRPYADRIRVTTDLDLSQSFKHMFYHFHDNQWEKENVQ